MRSRFTYSSSIGVACGLSAGCIGLKLGCIGAVLLRL